jgi:hypothetical protein
MPHNATTSGSITITGKMGKQRAGHAETLLPNGKVLIAGGMESEAVTSGAWIYHS